MNASTNPALHGLHVLDRSTRLSGAFCARLFGDWGATVVQLEPPGGHPLRAEPPFASGPDGGRFSLLDAYASYNKTRESLDPADTAALDRWLAWADVLVTNAEVDDPVALAARDAGLLVLALTPYGLDGPLAGLPGNDMTASARSAWTGNQGDPGRPPLSASPNQVGYLTGLTAFVAAVGALYERDRTGLGQIIDASELEAQATVAAPAILVAGYAGAAAPKHEPDMVRGPVPCRDGYFSLTISRAQFWRDAMNVLGLHDLAEDERYASGNFRRTQREHYTGRVQEQIAQWEKRDLFEALAAIRCVGGMVLSPKDVAENEHLAERGFFVPHEIAPGVQAHVPGPPLRMTATPWRLQPSPPKVEPSPRSSPPPKPEASAAPHGPLHGVRAIVLTQAWSGTYSTELLGFLGAEIIQIEARQRPDSWRGGYDGPIPAAIRDAGRRQRSWNTNGLYNAVNLNKRAVTIDLSKPRGLDLYRRMIPYSDLVAENFTPRVMSNLGLDYASLKKIRPDIILASLSAYGATGPYANVPGIGGTIEPMSGLTALLGYEGERPQNSGSMYPDPVSGLYFAAAMIMALRHRALTGEGQFIDLGMMEACATFTGDALLEAMLTGNVRGPMGNRHPRLAPQNIYQAADGWLGISVPSDEAWSALTSHIGRPGLATDPRYATEAARKQHERELDEHLAAWAATQSVTEASDALLRLGVVAAPVWNTREVLHDPQLAAREYFVTMNHPEAGRVPQSGLPWKLSRTPAAVTRPAPMLGEHSREVLAEFAGVSDEEYEELVALGITGDMPPD